MRISGTEPSSVILSQICSIKCWKVITKKVPKQAEAKRDEKRLLKPYKFNNMDLTLITGFEPSTDL